MRHLEDATCRVHIDRLAQDKLAIGLEAIQSGKKRRPLGTHFRHGEGRNILPIKFSSGNELGSDLRRAAVALVCVDEAQKLKEALVRVSGDYNLENNK